MHRFKKLSEELSLMNNQRLEAINVATFGYDIYFKRKYEVQEWYFSQG